jgi:hypothetical protein
MPISVSIEKGKVLIRTGECSWIFDLEDKVTFRITESNVSKTNEGIGEMDFGILLSDAYLLEPTHEIWVILEKGKQYIAGGSWISIVPHPYDKGEPIGFVIPFPLVSKIQGSLFSFKDENVYFKQKDRIKILPCSHLTQTIVERFRDGLNYWTKAKKQRVKLSKKGDYYLFSKGKISVDLFKKLSNYYFGEVCSLTHKNDEREALWFGFNNKESFIYLLDPLDL